MTIARLPLSLRLSATAASAILTAAMLGSVDHLTQPGDRVAGSAMGRRAAASTTHPVVAALPRLTLVLGASVNRR